MALMSTTINMVLCQQGRWGSFPAHLSVSTADHSRVKTSFLEAGHQVYSKQKEHHGRPDQPLTQMVGVCALDVTARAGDDG